MSVDAVKRFRLSTLMLLVLVAALCFVLVIQEWRLQHVQRQLADRESRSALADRVAKLQALIKADRKANHARQTE
jgi:hypothetical protein